MKFVKIGEKNKHASNYPKQLIQKLIACLKVNENEKLPTQLFIQTMELPCLLTIFYSKIRSRVN